MANTYNTGNSIGSTDPRDAYDNASNFDEFALSTDRTYTDRLGVQRKTVTGTLQDYAAYNLRGEWTTATAYNVNDVWRDGEAGSFYLVLADYTSGVSAAADITTCNVALFQSRMATEAEALAGTPGVFPDAAQVGSLFDSRFDALQAMVQGRMTFETKAQLDAYTPTADANGQYQLAEVWDDSTENNNGLYGWTGTAWKKSQYDLTEFLDGVNLAFDPLNQFVADYPTINGFNHFGSYSFSTDVNSFSASGRAIVSPAAGSSVYRNFPVPADWIGKVIRIRTHAEYETGGNFKVVFRDGSGGIISSNSVFPAPIAGADYYLQALTVPASAASMTIVHEPDPGTIVKVDFYGISFYGLARPVASPDFSPIEESISAINARIDAGQVSALKLHDPYNELAALAKTVDGRRLIIGGVAASSEHSPWGTPAIVLSSPTSTRIERLYDLTQSDIELGDTFDLAVTTWGTGARSIKIYWRTDTFTPSAQLKSAVQSTVGLATNKFTNITWSSASYSYLSVIVDDDDLANDVELIFGNIAPAGEEIVTDFNRLSMQDIARDTVGAGVYRGALYDGAQRLSPDGLYVQSARQMSEISGDLWEFIADGQRYRVLSSNPEVVVAVTADETVTLILINGQSLSVGDSSGSTPNPAAAITGYWGRMLSPAGYATQGPGDSALNAGSITGVKSVVGDVGTSPGVSAMYHALRIDNDRSFLLLSHGISGQQIEYLAGGNAVANGAIQMASAKAIIESYGLTVNPEVFLVWNQGEADGTDTNYESDLDGLIDWYQAAVDANLGTNFSLTVLLDQVSRSYAINPALAQYQTARDRDDTIMALTKGAMQLEFNMDAETGNQDGTHMSKRGYWYMGAYWGKAIGEILKTGRYEPLLPVDITVSGNTIVVDWPENIVSDPLVQIDHYGFSYSDSLGNTITGSQLKKRQVILTLSGNADAATSRVLSCGLTAMLNGAYIGSSLKRESRWYIPAVDRYMHDWAIGWSEDI